MLRTFLAVMIVLGFLFISIAPCPAAETAAPEKAPAAKAGGAPELPSAPAIDAAMKDPNHKVGFIRKTLRLKDGTERIYQVWVPLDYTADKKWPVILFLHGAGECGTDGEKVLIQGLPKEIRKRDGKFEFIVVIPQCESMRPKEPAPEAAKEAPKAKGDRFGGRWGWIDAQEELVMAALAATLKEYSCDTDREYLTGLSMGGFGTYLLALKYPKEFVALVPICGGGDTGRAKEFADIPIWIWHGDADKTVPVDRSRKMVEALKAAGAKELKYTEVPDVGHNSWDNTYASDELWTWLLNHRRSAAVK